MKHTSIKVGEVLSTTHYMTVVGKTTDSITVKDSLGKEFTVKGKKLIEAMDSNSQYDKTEVVNKTKAAEILTGAGDAVFSVTFIKADGKRRNLTGRLLDTENLLGRSNVTDLEVTTGTNLRQVDHRTIEEIILKGTKYTVK